MWGFGSNTIAGTSGPKTDSTRPGHASSDCSDDEISLNNSREEGLECPICWESFNIVENVPYVLWCGHTLCKNCVLGLQWAVVKLPTLPIQLPFFISCPWCNLLSFRLVYKGVLKFPRKNYFLLWMVESLNGDRVKSHTSSCADHIPVPTWSWTRGLVTNPVSHINHVVGPRVREPNRNDDSRAATRVVNDGFGTLLHTEIHKVFLHMSRIRKTSPGTRKTLPGTYKMESSGPKVPSRYLSGATGSCHDNCKSATKQTTETKSINPSPKRVPKPAADRTQVDAANSVHRIKKSPSIIPKVTTRNVKNNNVPTDQFIKKDVAIEPKKRDLKLKSVNSSAKTYNPPTSRTTRRHSDIFLPSKDMQMPSTKVPQRRLSEIIPNKDVASVSNVPLVQSSRISKKESRKDSPKLPLLNKRSNSLKTTVSTPKTGPKLPPLRTAKSLPKTELKESRKSKPTKVTEEVVPENTLHVTVSGNGVEATKSQSHSSLASSSSEEKTFADGQTGLQVSAPLMVDDIPNNGDQDDEQIGPQASPSMEDDTAAKDGRNIEQTGLQVSSPSMEDNTSTKDDQDNKQSGLQDNEKIGLHLSIPSMEDYTPVKDGQHNEQTGLQVSSPILKDNTPTEDGQQDENLEVLEVSDTKEETRSGKLKVETEDDSPDDIRFRRGTILTPQSGDSSPRKLEFKTGKELDENEAENAENANLRRLSSDGLVCSPESNVISVDLKHQEMEEKKDPGLSNNVIEETASKLIRARKSKVKALVGAFETMVSGNIK